MVMMIMMSSGRFVRCILSCRSLQRLQSRNGMCSIFCINFFLICCAAYDACTLSAYGLRDACIPLWAYHVISANTPTGTRYTRTQTQMHTHSLNFFEYKIKLFLYNIWMQLHRLMAVVIGRHCISLWPIRKHAHDENQAKSKEAERRILHQTVRICSVLFILFTFRYSILNCPHVRSCLCVRVCACAVCTNWWFVMSVMRAKPFYTSFQCLQIWFGFLCVVFNKLFFFFPSWIISNSIWIKSQFCSVRCWV